MCPTKTLQEMYNVPAYKEVLHKYFIWELEQLTTMLELFDTPGPDRLGGPLYCHFTKERLQEYIELYKHLLENYFTL